MKQSTPSDPLPEAAALLRDLAALKKLLASPEAKRLRSLLSEGDTGRLRAAAEQARQGDSDALRAAAREILARPEHGALLRKLERDLSGGKSR